MAISRNAGNQVKESVFAWEGKDKTGKTVRGELRAGGERHESLRYGARIEAIDPGLGIEIMVLAATLAVLGYSVNESVVIFDRIREMFRKQRKMSTSEVIDHAITSTISRTIITHGSTQMMVLSMLLFGGEALHYFAVALTIGICFGIYSSVLVACPLVMWLGVKREQLAKPVKQKQEAVV